MRISIEGGWSFGNGVRTIRGAWRIYTHCGRDFDGRKLNQLTIHDKAHQRRRPDSGKITTCQEQLQRMAVRQFLTAF
jgi:hypothetical protein